MPEREMVTRIDQDQSPDWMSSKFERTSEGYLSGRAVLTNVGVFTYIVDGEIIRELRLPEEVFSYETMKSMEMIPVTLDHPSVFVDSNNVKDLQVGHTGNGPSRYRDPEWGMIGYSDGLHVSNDVIITDKEAVVEVENGKRALSCGYSADVEQADPGSVWLGISYDAIQRNIRYNHVAIVDQARAGEAARIRLDSVEINEPIKREKEINMAMKKIILDGVEFEAEADVIKALKISESRADAAVEETVTVRADLSKVEGERDALKDENIVLVDKVKTLEETKIDEAEIQKRVDAFLATKIVADFVKVEIKDGMTDIDIKKAVIVAKYPAAKLDEKDDVYIQARFDAIAELIEDENEGDEESREAGGASHVDVTGKEKGEHADTVEDARARMVKRNQDASLGATDKS